MLPFFVMLYLVCFQFSLFKLPIIPLLFVLSSLLLFVLYAAFVTDLHRQCSAPLHGYAIVSLILFIYAPNHRAIKHHLFHYSRERDGPNRPRSVRVYDQAFQTTCILYVYFGMTLIQTTGGDVEEGPIGLGGGGSGGVTNALTSSMPSYYRDRDDVRECCICMAEFRLDEAEFPEELAQLARNRDVMRVSGDFIVRTKCNHFFHFRCIGGWLGGQWTEQGGTIESQRARRRACPLCREDLAPISASQRASSGMSGVDRAVVESTALLEPGNSLM